MRVLLPAFLVGSLSAVRVSRSDLQDTVSGSAVHTDDDEQLLKELQEALQEYSDANLDPNMPLEEAVDHVVQRGVPSALTAALKEANMTDVPSALLSHSNSAQDESHEEASSDGDSNAAGEAAPKVNPVVARIFKIINGMIIQDQNKLVLKVFQCKKQQTAFKSAYRSNRMNFQAESYKLQEALSSEKTGQLEQFEASARLRKLIPTRNALKRRCAADIRQMQAEFRRISYDFALARKIADGTSCAKKPKKSFLQSCMRMVEDGKQEAVVEFAEGSSERDLVDLMQTSVGKAAVARGLIEAVGPENLEGEPPAHLYEVNARLQREAQRWLREQGDADGDDEDEQMSEEADELAHRETEFNDYFFEDPDFEEESGVIEEPYQASPAEEQDNQLVQTAIAEVSTETEDTDKDLSDADAPPGGWISEKALDQAEKELVLIGAKPTAKNLTLPKKQVNRKTKMNAKFFCTVANNPNCPRFRDKLEMIVAELLSEKQHAEWLLSTTRSECTKQIAELDTQISTMDAKKSDGARIEAAASARKSDSTGAIASIEREGRKLLRTFAGQTKDCRSELKNLRNTVCGSKKLKQEVITIEAKQRKGKRLEINDCSVGDWRPQECMNTKIAQQLEKQGIFNPQKAVNARRPLKSLLHKCGPGGGVQWFLRDKVSPPQTPQYGANCPPLRLKTVCNDFECPVNCKLADWEGWSACSKTCDGGLKRRVRSVTVYPQWGGSSCDSTKDEQTCNALSCDRPCLLHNWGPWRACTRACDKGMRWRSRKIKRAATGDGRCPRTFSKARYERQVCNAQPCPLDVMCVARMDLVIGIDASGSMGTSGWKAQRTALLGLINRLQFSKKSGLQLGVLKFSYKVNVLQQLTDDKKKLVAAVTKTTFDRWTTNIGGAFRSMKGMLQFGRRDAPSVCMLWTDGRPSRPSSKYDAALGAKDLRSSCRVMVVTMRPAVPKAYVAPWVSHPKSQNVMVVQHPNLMVSKVMDVNTFVCGKVQRFLDWTKAQNKTKTVR